VARPSRASWVIWGAVTTTVLLRLPLLHLPAWADEAGFLTVGGGWHLGDSGDRTLYDAYWVDRPPVLISVFGLAERLGGLVPLRLFGALAAAATVASAAWLARSVAGARAGAWAAVTGAALLSSPFHWAFMVDGELVAAPFVATGLACTVNGLAREGPRGLLLTAAGGACAVTALLVKQNIADVFVFVVAVLAAGIVLRTLTFRQAASHLAAFGAGVLGCGALLAGWTLAHGTSLGSVFYAMYPFRVDAAHVTSTGTTDVSWHRLLEMTLGALLSGLLVLVVGLLVAGVRRRHRDAVVLALLVVLVFDLFSVVAGTNYWLHYLVQPAVVVAALTGIVVARGSWLRWMSAAAVVTCLAGWTVLVLSPPQTEEELVGRAIARASQDGDSIVTVPGRANVSYAAGLRSPYPYLWALPARTLDPRGAGLRRLVAGPRAPTWLVTVRAVRRHPRPGTVAAAVMEHYRPVARICGSTVYLHRRVERAVPVASPRADATRASQCRSVADLPHVLREIS
jgi:hypothetical protein